MVPQCQRAEATQLDAIASHESVGNFPEEAINDALGIAREKMRVGLGQYKNEFGSHHSRFLCRAAKPPVYINWARLNLPANTVRGARRKSPARGSVP
jgi:hypothetical protein